MLEIKNIHAQIDEKSILKGINLDIKAGEVHAIMGPNGSGKSTLASVIAGKEEYEIEQGSILFGGKDIGELSVEERAHQGVFCRFNILLRFLELQLQILLKQLLTKHVKQKA